MIEWSRSRVPNRLVARVTPGFRNPLGGTTMSLLWEILIGIVAGWLAGQIVKGRGMGVIVDLIVGIIGALLGGWIFGLLGMAAYGLIGQLVVATVGAVILLLLIRLVKKS
jgi:uncharacterized membrane protein YeaQ/YmgE (transglycosylase-associated protein family)